MKNILIIGATSGIAKAITQQLAKDSNHHLILTARQPGEGQHALDLQDDDSIQAFSKTLLDQATPLDLIINCVGVLHTDHYQPEKKSSQINRAQLNHSFNVNCVGHLLILNQLFPLVRKATQPVVVSLSAMVGSIDDNRLGGWYSYRMSKAALNMGLKTLSIEWKRTAPRCALIAMHPGTTDTGLSKPFQKNLPKGQAVSCEQAATRILSVIDTIQPEHTGSFYNFDGSIIPW